MCVLFGGLCESPLRAPTLKVVPAAARRGGRSIQVDSLGLGGSSKGGHQFPFWGIGLNQRNHIEFTENAEPELVLYEYDV